LNNEKTVNLNPLLLDDEEVGDGSCEAMPDHDRDGDGDAVAVALEAAVPVLLDDTLDMAETDALGDALRVMLGVLLAATDADVVTEADTLGDAATETLTMRLALPDTFALGEGEAVCDTVEEAHTGGAAASIATWAAVSARSQTRRSSMSCDVIPAPYASPP
jgi:hypothetical protein